MRTLMVDFITSLDGNAAGLVDPFRDRTRRTSGG
jgi:hypothetical protein